MMKRDFKRRNYLSRLFGQNKKKGGQIQILDYGWAVLAEKDQNKGMSPETILKRESANKNMISLLRLTIGNE